MSKIREYGLWINKGSNITLYLELENGLVAKLRIPTDEHGETMYCIAPHWAYWGKWCPWDFANGQEGEPPWEIRRIAEMTVQYVQPQYTACRNEQEALELHYRIEHMCDDPD